MFIGQNRNDRIGCTGAGNAIGSKSHLKDTQNSANLKKGFDEIWKKIVLLQGETFFTVTGVQFTYKVVEDRLFPLHIRFGYATKSGFEKAYRLEKIVSPSQLSSEGILGPSYVFSILLDERVRNRE